jgi:hypothetical protein
MPPRGAGTLFGSPQDRCAIISNYGKKEKRETSRKVQFDY